MSRMTRTDWGLDTIADEHWSTRSACRHDPELWWPGSGLNVDTAQNRLAAHVCRRHCPVREKCLDDLSRVLAGPRDRWPRECVQAGLHLGNSGMPSVTQPADIGCGRHCQQIGGTS